MKNKYNHDIPKIISLRKLKFSLPFSSIADDYYAPRVEKIIEDTGVKVCLFTTINPFTKKLGELGEEDPASILCRKEYLPMLRDFALKCERGELKISTDDILRIEKLKTLIEMSTHRDLFDSNEEIEKRRLGYIETKKWEIREMEKREALKRIFPELPKATAHS